MDDVNDRAREAWRAETTSRERIKAVLSETTEYATAAEIADRALTSEPTTRKYLEELVEDGFGVAEQDGRTTRYRRDEERLVDERIAELRATKTREELVEGIREMKERLRGFRETHGVESPEELAVELDADEEGWGDVGRWRTTRRNLAIAQAALQVENAHRIAEA